MVLTVTVAEQAIKNKKKNKILTFFLEIETIEVSLLTSGHWSFDSSKSSTTLTYLYNNKGFKKKSILSKIYLAS